MSKLTMTELFCGAGIGAVGFKQAGYNITWACDFNEYAIKTYRQNIGEHAHVIDVKTLKAEDMPDADVITGGFPCQPFSIGGSRKGKEDEKSGNLGFHFFRLIEEKAPKAFIAENVEGLATQHKDFLAELIRHIDKAGYNVTWKLVDCWEYGAPQTRNRVFIVGIRKDLNKHFIWPDRVPINKRTALRDAIKDLPEPEEAEKHNIKNHSIYHVGGFSPRDMSQKRQRQWHEPSYTIVSSARHLPVHPEPPNFDFRVAKMRYNPPRRFTVRECLRIQTVPDWYYFPHDSSYTEKGLLARQYERCSGIPPLVSYKLGKQLADILTDKIETKKPVQSKLF